MALDAAGTPPPAAISGVGIGLRAAHISEILGTLPPVPWFEVLVDNHMADGGLPVRSLERIREHYAITFHSVALSLGSTDPLDGVYLRKLKDRVDRFQPAWVSEHLCWTSVHGRHFHDLLPLPYTVESAMHVARRIEEVQEFLGQRILIENVSSYLTFAESEMSEAEFVSEVSRRADCLLLLDINNVYVSCVNSPSDPLAYIRGLPAERICELHLGGHEDDDGFLLDSHATPVADPVWDLYAAFIGAFGTRPTLLEWDNNLPKFSVLQEQARHADQILASHHANA